ncbi:hypothetical protein [Terricaulis sp.]|uniref:hypothetical protein n=1 Tax=Terricaulis sp. TaxID=2768686 RepID=UPI002AC65B9E|nr:hypothetical protein [Terricaulis sp.]MDZ4690932.1 hypothetical protein [Terricaulis sp.]
MNRLPLLHIYAYDTRYSVPQWRTVDADPAQAHTVAQQILDEHETYLGVEVWLEDQRLVEVRRGAKP